MLRQRGAFPFIHFAEELHLSKVQGAEPLRDFMLMVKFLALQIPRFDKGGQSGNRKRDAGALEGEVDASAHQGVRGIVL